jgi:hypothetical protein
MEIILLRLPLKERWTQDDKVVVYEFSCIFQEMIFLKTQYVNPFGGMNDHLIRYKRTLSAIQPPVTTWAHRQPPRMVAHILETQKILSKTFGLLPSVFEPHVAQFTRQTITIRHGRSCGNPPVIDVRYRWCNEYYHFLTEALPNALLMSRQHPGLAISCAVAPFTVELFRWFGIESPILWAGPAYGRVLCRYVECGNPSPEKIAAIRDVVTARVRFQDTLGILIRRQRSRRILNEAGLLEQLRSRYPDLEWVVFDRLSVADTATLFSQAAVIAGPHGAGFTNMLFSKAGTRIIEFMPLEQPNLCYWHLSEMLGNPYVMIPTRSDRTRSMVAELGTAELFSNRTS